MLAGAVCLVAGLALLSTWTPAGVLIGTLLIVAAFLIRDH